MKEFLNSCVTCPAALICRSTGVHYSGSCTECEHPWIVMLRDNKSYKVYIVRFPQNHPCDEKEHRWAKNASTDGHNTRCPECCGPGRGKLGQWSVVYGKEIFYADFGGDSPRFSKI